MTGSHSSLEFDLLEQADPGALVQAIANLREPRTTTGGVNLMVGFRPSLWRRVAPQELPAGVSDFDQEVRGVDGRTGGFCSSTYPYRHPENDSEQVRFAHARGWLTMTSSILSRCCSVLAKLKGGQDPSLCESNVGASPKMNANQM